MIELLLGNCLDVIETISLNGVDAVVTDTPYGIDGGKGGDSRDYGKGDYTGLFPDTEDDFSATAVPSPLDELFTDTPMLLPQFAGVTEENKKPNELLSAVRLPGVLAHGRNVLAHRTQKPRGLF